MKYLITKNKNWFAIINLIVLLFICTATLIIMLILIINDYNSLLELGVLIILVFSFALYILNYVFWQFRGYEEIEFTETELIIWRKGKLINDKVKIKTSLIYSIEEQDYKPIIFTSTILRNPFIFSKTIGETGGRILVKYGKNGKLKRDFGLGLTLGEAKRLVQEMNLILQLANEDTAPNQELSKENLSDQHQVFGN